MQYIGLYFSHYISGVHANNLVLSNYLEMAIPSKAS